MHFLSYLLKPIDGKLIVGVIKSSSSANRSNFHERGAASPENFIIGFIRVYLRIAWFKCAALGRSGGPRRVSGAKGNRGPVFNSLRENLWCDIQAVGSRKRKIKRLKPKGDGLWFSYEI